VNESKDVKLSDLSASTSFFTDGAPVSHCRLAASPSKKSQRMTQGQVLDPITAPPAQYILFPVTRTVCCMLSSCLSVTARVVPIPIPLPQGCADWNTKPRCGRMRIVVVKCGGSLAWLFPPLALRYRQHHYTIQWSWSKCPNWLSDWPQVDSLTRC